MDSTPSFHPLDYVSVLRRRVWWLVVPIVVTAVVGTAVIMWLPRTYQTQATIGISLPGVSGQLLNDTQRVSAQERARNIAQTLLSQEVLERVVSDEGLDAHMPVSDAVRYVRANVQVNVPQNEPSLPRGGVVETFNVLYIDSTPELAQRVANRLADVFVAESSRKREVRAEETSSFIAQKLMESKERLDEFEARLRLAKETFMGALPEQTNANVSLVTGLQQQLESTSNSVRGDQDRLSSIERQLEALEAGPAIGGAGSAGTAPVTARVVALERELAVALNSYTSRHPEVVRLQNELAKAKSDAAADAQKPVSDRVATLSVDPAYRGLMKERDDIRLRIADGQRRQAAIQSQIGEYRARVDAAPRAEQQISTVQREYDLERQQYTNLTNKLRDAQMNESLERSQGGERFTVLQHAGWPSQPFSPNVPRLLAMAVLVGVCLGGGLALGREYLDRSIHDTRALADLDLPVLGEIPHITARA